jgi:plastocyanin
MNRARRLLLVLSAGTAFITALAGMRSPGAAASVSGNVTLNGAGSNATIELVRCVVYLDADPALAGSVNRDEERPQIEQRDKAFVPDFLVVPQGTTVEFPNWDPFSHNVFSRSRAASFDLDRFGQGQSKSYTFETPGAVQVFCNIHPQMRAVVLVVPNRFFVRPDGRGRFVLRDVPLGQYTLVCWHARLGEQRQPVRVTSDGLQGVSMVLAGGGSREIPEARDARAKAPGVERGLGKKRERLDLPVVTDAHPAPPPKR